MKIKRALDDNQIIWLLQAHHQLHVDCEQNPVGAPWPPWFPHCGASKSCNRLLALLRRSACAFLGADASSQDGRKIRWLNNPGSIDVILGVSWWFMMGLILQRNWVFNTCCGSLSHHIQLQQHCGRLKNPHQPIDSVREKQRVVLSILQMAGPNPASLVNMPKPEARISCFKAVMSEASVS